MSTHSYDKFRRDSQSSEYHHLVMLNDLTEKVSYEARFKQTPEEKKELKKRMLNYPNKNHKPIN